MEKNDFDICELSWADAAKDIKRYNKTLFNAIDASLPSKKHTLIKARYPFGAKIIDNGLLHLPHKSGISVPLHSSAVEAKVREKLTYAKIPLAFLSNKASEVFIERSGRAVPLKLLFPGNLFGLFEVINLLSGIVVADPVWCVSSGAHSLFMLPKITDKFGYQRIKKAFNLEISPPHSLIEHKQIFTSLCNHEMHKDKWYSEVYFFTNHWFEDWERNLQFAHFYNYIFKESAVQRHFTNANLEFDLTWQNFTMAISARNFRPRPYMFETAKYLLAVSEGMLPGFKIADNTDVVGPIQLLQDIYVNVYGLKSYLPTLMHPCNQMAENKKVPVYYSLSFPAVIEGLSPYKTNARDIISDMRLMKKLLHIPSELVSLSALKTMTKISQNVSQFEYFHSKPDIYGEIRSASEIPITDATFLQDKGKFPDRVFCATAPFFSGCIRILA